MNKNVLIIGPGKLGTSLYRFLREKRSLEPALCGRMPENCLNSPHLNLKNFYSNFNISLIKNNEIIFICTQDRHIRAVAEDLTKFDLNNKYIFHTSGFYSSELLSGLNSNFHAGTFHPVQSFPKRFQKTDVWINIYCTFEGDPAGLKIIQELFTKTNINIYGVTAEQKKSLHLSATLLSNYGVALFKWVEDIIHRSKMDISLAKRILSPILFEVVSHFKEAESATRLTGPLQRGDLEILENHLALLTPNQQNVYREIARLIAKDSAYDLKNREALLEFINGNKD
jgi:predicted short-subunit dehydrogenase-like oxidoreductase (DUF2520 family)